MPKVFFYHNARDKLLAACQLLGKACHQGKRVTVYSPSNNILDTLDRLLWTYQPTGFVPHCHAESELADETPILLTHHINTIPDRLMNLDNAVPPNLDKLNTIIEVVGQDEADRLPARQRFKIYKDSGCEIQSFDLSTPSKEKLL